MPKKDLQLRTNEHELYQKGTAPARENNPVSFPPWFFASAPSWITADFLNDELWLECISQINPFFPQVGFGPHFITVSNSKPTQDILIVLNTQKKPQKT